MGLFTKKDPIKLFQRPNNDKSNREWNEEWRKRYGTHVSPPEGRIEIALKPAFWYGLLIAILMGWVPLTKLAENAQLFEFLRFVKEALR